MPNIRKKIEKYMDIALKRPEYYRPMLENAGGYRSYKEAKADYKTVKEERSIAFGYSNLDRIQRKQATVVYARTGRPTLEFMVLGRSAMGGLRGAKSSENFPLLDDTLVFNMGSLNEAPGGFGSILNSDNWTVYMNDMMISGGVANRTPFYLASRRDMRSLWINSRNRPTLLARELVGLLCSGYEINQLQDGSEILIATQHTQRLNISTYMEVLSKFKNKFMIEKLTNFNLRQMRYFPSSGHVAMILD